MKFTCFRIALAMAFSVSVLSVDFSAQTRPAGQAGLAPGGPIVNCSEIGALRTRLQSGLPTMDEAIRRTEAQIESARADVAAANDAARSALTDALISELRGIAEDYLTSARVLRTRLAAMREAGLTAAQRRAHLEVMTQLEAIATEVELAPDAIQAIRDYQAREQALRNTTARLRDRLASLNRLFVDSGAAESLGETIAGFGGPMSEIAFKLGKLGIDVATGLAQAALSEAELFRAQENLVTMSNSRFWVSAKIADLTAQIAQHCTVPQPQQTSLTPPLPDPQPSGGSTVKTVVKWVAIGIGSLYGAAALAVGLAAALDEPTGETISPTEIGGSSTSGQCISSRICTVNQLSGTCTCTGSAQGPCNYFGTPADINQGCAGGIPCRSGLWCNNGRCEDPDSGGRCHPGNSR